MPSRSPDLDKVLLGLGRAIGEARREKGMTQKELARTAEVHATYISLIERGKRNPRWGVVRRISRSLGVSPPELALRAEELERKP